MTRRSVAGEKGPARGADELEPRVVGEELPDDLGGVEVPADPPDDGPGEILRASRPGVAASINPVQRDHRMLRALEVSGLLYPGPVRGEIGRASCRERGEQR